jgi:hypothetical protein
MVSYVQIFRQKCCMYSLYLPCLLRAHRPSLFNYPNSEEECWRVEIMKLFIMMQLSPAADYLFQGPNIILSTVFSNIP